VLERDPDPPYDEAGDNWESWQRRGVTQFRLPHYFLACFRHVLETELPEVAKALEDAGRGSVENLFQRALENAVDHAGLVAGGICPSPYTISVHVPRLGRATKDELLANPPYSLYRPYLEAPARSLLDLDFVQIVATTILSRETAPSSLDLSHYDLVVIADELGQLSERIGEVRAQFERHDNPGHKR
jgi:hypothetical protein